MNFSAFQYKLRDKETAVYSWLCTGIIYTLFTWSLANSILCIILSAYWLFISKKTFRSTTGRSRLVMLFISIFILAVIGMLYTSNVSEGLFRLQQKLGLIMFPVIFGTTRVVNFEFLKKISTHFIVGLALTCSLGLGYYFFMAVVSNGSSMATNHDLILFEDTQPYTVGLYCLTGIVLILYNKQVRFSLRKNLQYFLIMLFSIFIFLISVRLIVACWMLIALVFILDHIKSGFYRIVGGLVMISIVIIAVATIPALNRQWKELKGHGNENVIVLDQDASLGKSWGGKAIRLAIWSCSKDILQNNWLIGVGTGDVQDNLQRAYEKRKFYFASRYNRYNAHNQYLQLWIANGIASVFLLVATLIIPLFLLHRNNALKSPYTFFLVFAGLIFFTESIFDTNKGIIWYSFFNSIFAFTYLFTPKPA
jgi:O-antigen ligase